MKPWIALTAVGMATLSRPALSQPFDESKGGMFYELSKPLRKPIVPPPGDTSLDDYIIALSKNSDINFIADVTQRPADERVGAFPNSAKAIEGNWKPTFYAVSEDLENAQNLSELRYNDTTYLLWSTPDAMRAARLMIAAGKNHAAEPLPDQLELHRALDDYLRDAMGWTKEAVPTAGDINVELKKLIEANALTEEVSQKVFQPKLGDLPPALRAQLVTVTRNIALQAKLNPAQYFTDEFWKTARFRVTVFDSPISPVVYVAGAPKEGEAPLFANSVSILTLVEKYLEYDIFPPIARDEKDQAEPAQEKLAAVPRSVDPALANAQMPLIGDTLRSTEGLTGEQLEAEAGLQASVSLQEKRRPLGDLVTSVGQAQGVKLVVSQEVPAALVTLRVSEMPLGTLMGALARVYGAYWDQQSPKEFTLHARVLDELKKLILRSGKGDFSVGESNRNSHDPIDQQQREVALSIAALMNQRQIESEADFAVADLPEDLQFQLRRHFEEAAAIQLTDSYFRAWRFIAPYSPLRLTRDHSPFTSDWKLTLAMDQDALAVAVIRGPELNYEGPAPQ